MNAILIDGISCEISGTTGPWVVLSHSLGCTKTMWKAQVETLQSRFRVIAYDLPGHGESAEGEGPGSIESLAKDVLKLLDWAGADRAHFAGLSIGGMIGQQLAVSAGHRIDKLILANCGFETPKQAKSMWNDRIARATENGVGSLASATMSRWFTDQFRAAHPAIVAAAEAQFSRTSLAGYRYCCEAIIGLNMSQRLSELNSLTLVLTGSKDVGVPPILAEQLAALIPRASVQQIEGAGHLSAIDSAEQFNALIEAFL